MPTCGRLIEIGLCPKMKNHPLCGWIFITTDVGCCRELIYGGSNDDLGPAGAVVAPMDYEQMAKEIIRLGKNFPLRRKMGQVGWQRVKNGYTYEYFIDSYRKIFQQLEGAEK